VRTAAVPAEDYIAQQRPKAIGQKPSNFVMLSIYLGCGYKFYRGVELYG
jgi:hypothetical protein